MVTKRADGSKPAWSDVKASLADFDRAAMLALVQAMYAANKDNQAFLHTRFGLGGDVLKPYKDVIQRWVSPDVFRNQDVSVAKAKKAISDYKKALGRPNELAELMTFYCEQAIRFAGEYGMADEGYLEAACGVLRQLVKLMPLLEPGLRDALLDRLDRLPLSNLYGGYGDDIEELRFQARGGD